MIFRLFLFPVGRIDRKAFYAGWLVLWAAQAFLIFMPMINLMMIPVLNYMVICLVSKRLNHIGIPGIIVIFPYLAFVVYLIVSFVGGLASFSGSGISHKYDEYFVPAVIAMIVLHAVIGLIPGKTRRAGHRVIDIG